MAAIGPKTKSGRFRSKSRKTKRKSKAKRPMMIQSTQRKLPACPQTANAGYTFQLDKALSQMNHKLYRQGMNYHGKVTLAQNQSKIDRSYSIYTIATDHRTIGALRMARSVYNQAVKDELEIRPDVKSAWTDFKIEPYSNVAGSTATFKPWKDNARVVFLNSALLGVTNDTRGISDAYNASEITTNAGVQTKFMLAGYGNEAAESAFNVFQQYRNFLLNRADPDSAVETPAYGDASPVLTEMAELADKGDEPPYAWNQMADNIAGTDVAQELTLVLQGVISPDDSPTGMKTVSFEAPLGLVYVVASHDMSTTVPELIFEVSKGNYKGVKADRLYPKDKLLGF
jgi:hypothetical protein